MRAELLSRLYTRRLEILRIRARARAWRRMGRAAAAGLAPRPGETGLRDHDDGKLLPEVLRAEAFRNALALGT